MAWFLRIACFVVIVTLVAVRFLNRDENNTPEEQSERPISIDPDVPRALEHPGQEPQASAAHQPGPAAMRPDPRSATPTAPAKRSRTLRELIPEQFVVVDLETTGLHPSTSDIIEIGAIKVTLDEQEHPALHVFVKPKRKLTPKITSITGITQQMLDEHGVELHSAMADFIKFVGDLPLVTYNAPFDMGFLWAAANSCGMKIENRYTCALQRARRAFPYLENHKLQTVASHLSAPDHDQHRALADSLRAAHVFLASTAEINMKVRWSNYGPN